VDKHVVDHWNGKCIAGSQDFDVILFEGNFVPPVRQLFMPVSKGFLCYGMPVTFEIQFHHCLMGLLVLHHVVTVFTDIETTHAFIVAPDFQMNELMEIENEGIQRAAPVGQD
jgi:hypothetical protein